MDDQLEIARLITGYIRKTLTVAEQDKLEELCRSDARIRRLVNEHHDIDSIHTALEQMQSYDTDKAWQRLLDRKYNSVQPSRQASIWVVASIATVFVLGSIVFWRYTRQVPTSLQKPIVAAHQVSPGSNRAQLLLSSGKTVDLDNRRQQLHEVNGMVVQNKKGALIYASHPENKTNVFNTLVVPKGGTYSLILSDGTKVWLNASSSLRFPVSFGAHERVVQLMGEAYFEVSKDKDRPFQVQVNGRSIRVLGTSFNVNAYHPDADVTTLISGAIEVENGEEKHVLKPGEQAVMQYSRIRVEKADLAKAIAWKEGYFLFNGDPVSEALAQVARWYDVDLEYHGKLPTFHIGGSIKRDEQLQDALNMLQDVSGLQFQVIGKKIIIDY